MCYSARVSIGTFLFAAVVAAWVAKRQPALAVAFVAIALMQLVEFFIWIDQGCGVVNQMATAALKPTLNLQPLLIALAMWWFRGGYAPNALYGVLALALMVSLGLAVGDAYREYGRCTRPGKSGRLAWHGVRWKNGAALKTLYYPVMAFLFATMKPIIVTWPLLALYTLTYEMSASPSVWCNTVNLVAAWALVAA